MSFLHGHALTAAIRTVVARPSDIAVAFWGNDACERLALPVDLAGYRIACDARSGACSPKALKELLKRGAALVDVPRLHAKVYRSGSAMVAASANVSGGGLSEDYLAHFGLEAGIATSDRAALKAASVWFDTLFKAGSTITAADIAEIAPLWDAARKSRPARASLLNAIMTQDAELTDRAIRVYVYTAGEPSVAHEAAYDATRYAQSVDWRLLDDVPFFWGTLPGQVAAGDELLCFEVDADGEVSCERVWRVLEQIGTGDNAIWPACEIKRPLGRPLGDGRAIARRVKAALAEGRLVADAPPLSLPDFAAAIAREGADEHLARIQNEPTREAYRLLSEAAPRLGFVQTNKTGRVPAARWHVGPHYLYSFIPNRAHLLFYVREPALAAAPNLAEEARNLGLVWNVNTAGEITLRVPDRAAAQIIIDWLASTPPVAPGSV